MIAVEHAGLLRPWFLLALPVVLVLAGLATRRVAALGGWSAVIDPGLMNALARRGAVVAGRGRRNLTLAGIATLLVLALVGPAI